MKNALLTMVYFLAIGIWFASMGYHMWFDVHTHREHTRPNEVSFRSKGKTHWTTPDELWRDGMVMWLGFGGSMIVALTINIYLTSSKSAANANTQPN